MDYREPAIYIMTNKRNGTLYTGVTSNLILTFPLQLGHFLVEVDHYAASFTNTEGGI